MKHIFYKDLENYEVAFGLKRMEKADGVVELWDVTKTNLLIHTWLFTEEEELGYWLYVEMSGCGCVQNLKTTDIVEACRQFNIVAETIKA